ncbi:MAG: putative lipid II flippase FtsW [Deltaproteobacteria bacterium]|nr:putative lipid II flippase FtsW [Deltaproteobacteria bacterium]
MAPEITIARLPRPRVDGPMLAAVLTLVGLGVVMVAAASGSASEAQTGAAFAILQRQAVFAGIGVVALALGAGIEPAALERRARIIVVVTVVLLALVLIPGLGHMAGGARRWLQLGPVGVQIGEIAKGVVVIYLATVLAQRSREQARRSGVGALVHLVIPGVMMVLLLLEPDFGTAVLIAAVSFLLLFVGGARVGNLAGLLALAVPLLTLVVSTSAYRMRRVMAFLEPWEHRYDIGYQITESLMTLGSGGAFGLGLGESRQRLFFLPAAHTDFILAVLGEELGFAGVTLVVACFAVIGWRALRAALMATSTFTSLLIVGLSSMLLVQAAFNIAVVLGLVPTKGITLPFVSAGGSSLVTSMFFVGLLLRAVADARAARGEV